jgi:hypothetical protein
MYPDIAPAQIADPRDFVYLSLMYFALSNQDVQPTMRHARELTLTTGVKRIGVDAVPARAIFPAPCCRRRQIPGVAQPVGAL